MLLLALCVTASVYGIVVISSATHYVGSTRYVLVQAAALLLGVAIYVLFTLVDVDILAERRELLLIFSALFISMLFVWGDTQNGNRSWLAFSWLPFNIQPAEICKVFFILILAKTMWLKEQGVYTGQRVAGSLCFCPDDTVTRGEFLVMKLLQVAKKVEAISCACSPFTVFLFRAAEDTLHRSPRPPWQPDGSYRSAPFFSSAPAK